ncbi:MAG: tRNA pseudouridine synthase A, partial [Spirochaetaceae bacterium]|nr:tRNA pseudouridine synthase A [Spirochaetaceae bacterium]
MRRNIKLVISYDGTEFAGWQIQSSDRSVQGVLTEALSDLHQESVSITGAGRTDSGVHAIGQVGNFHTEKDTIPDWKFRDALNARLPRDIRILSSIEVARDFHSRRDARYRQYEYRMIEGPAGPAHMDRFTWLIRRMPPLGALNDMASVICGTHDFS